MKCFQDLLLIRGLYQGVGGNDVRQPDRIPRIVHGQEGFRRHLIAQLDIVLKNRQNLAGQCLQLQIYFFGFVFWWSGNFDFIIRILFCKLQDPPPLQAINQHPDRITRQLQQLLDF